MPSLTPSERNALRIIVDRIQAGAVREDKVVVFIHGDEASIGEGKDQLVVPVSAATIEALERAGFIAVSNRSKSLYIFSVRAPAYEVVERLAVNDVRAFREGLIKTLYREAKGTTRKVEAESIAEALGRTEREVSDALMFLAGEGLVATRGSESGIIGASLTPEGIQRAERLIDGPEASPSADKPAHAHPSSPYIAERRLEELRSIKSENFDLRRLVQICEELNLAIENHSYVAAGALQRTIIHHVPSIFGAKNFETVVAQSPKDSFKKHMEHLLGSMKNAADPVLHLQAGTSCPPVEYGDIDFRSAINVLIQRVIDVLRNSETGDRA